MQDPIEDATCRIIDVYEINRRSAHALMMDG